jgi:hypothetical protein
MNTSEALRERKRPLSFDRYILPYIGQKHNEISGTGAIKQKTDKKTRASALPMLY